MARWEPNAQERLMQAALELFAEQGYDNTSVVEIAERAGLTKSTFFRHFSDKREVLFGGGEILGGLLTTGIASAPASAKPLDAVARGLDELATAFPPERHAFARRRRAVIESHSELQEREALKRASLVATMTAALLARGVEDPGARLAAELGVLAFSRAFERWTDSGQVHAFGVLAREELRELQAASAALS